MTNASQQVYTLLVQVGRAADDGLPEGATGAALVCYAAGRDQDEAVRETVAILKQADLAPLEVQGYGTLEDRLKQGDEMGRFLLGSTVVLLWPRATLKFNPDWAPGGAVRVGQMMGKALG